MRDSPDGIAKSLPGVGRWEVFRVFGSFEGISNVDTGTTGFDIVRGLLIMCVLYLNCAVNPLLGPFRAWKYESLFLHNTLFDLKVGKTD